MDTVEVTFLGRNGKTYSYQSHVCVFCGNAIRLNVGIVTQDGIPKSCYPCGHKRFRTSGDGSKASKDMAEIWEAAHGPMEKQGDKA
jgi:hypothetical protein